MALLGEAFTVLAVLEAVDKASEIYEKISGSLDSFTGTMDRAADVADTAGKAIDDGLLDTASGADALSLATARLVAAENDQALALERQAQAERLLLDAMAQVEAASDGDVAAATRLSAASRDLAAAQKEAATATKTLGEAEDVQSSTLDAQTAVAAAAAGGAAEAGEAAEDSGGKWESFAGAAAKVSLGLGIVAGLAVKSAISFQSMTTVLETSGGETAAQMGMVRSGILGISTATATGVQELTSGMYMIGSAGYTGQQGLNVLTTAAEGAKAEGADLATVGNALTTVMTNYYGTQLTAAQATNDSTAAMNEMIAVVSNGKTTTEALAASLSAVLPTAKAAGLSFAQVGGAMATMTGEGVSAQQAAQDLAFTIRSLQSPSSVAVNEMTALGLNSQQVSQQLGTKGLTGTMTELTDAIAKNTKGGSVLISTMANAKNATADAQKEIDAMPASLQKLANGFESGSINATQWRADLLTLTPTQQHLMTQFAATAEKANSFNSLLTSGSPAAQTYTTALDKMTGGATGLTTALDLTGTHALKFGQNVAAVTKAAGSASQGVSGWSEVQGTMSFKLDQAKESIEATGIALGTALLPAVTKVMNAILGVLKPIAEWMESHQKLAGTIMEVVIGIGLFLGAIVAVQKVVSGVTGAFGLLHDAWDGIGSVASGVSSAFSATVSGAQAVGGAISTAASATADFASSAGSAIAAFASSSWSGALSMVKSLGSSIATAASAAWDWVASAAAATAGALRQAAAFTAEKVAMIASTVAEKAATAAQWLFDAAMAIDPFTLIIIAIIALVAAFAILWTKSAAFRDFWIGLWGDVEKIAVDVWHAISSFFTQIVTDIVSFVEGHWRLLITIIGGPLGLAVALVTKYWGDIKQWFMDGVHAVAAYLEWFNGLPGMFLHWLEDAAEAVDHGINDVINFFKQLPSEIENLLSDAGSWLINVGENIISGLWNGISNALGGLESKVKGMAGDVAGWAKDALSIFSPSQVMADQVGKYIPAGIALGITSNLGVVEAATRQAGSAATTGLRSSLGGLTAAPAGAAGSAGSQLVIDLRGSQVMSNNDMDLLVNKIGRAIATRVLPAGGVRINLT